MSKIPRLVISGPIGDTDPFLELEGIETGTSADMVSDWLKQNAKAKEIEVEIRSNGGSVTQGFMIYDLLINSGKKITTLGYNIKSIATVIFMAGSIRKLSANAEFLIHNPWIDPFSLPNKGLTADDLQRAADDMRNEENRLVDFYSKHLSLDKDKKQELRALMDKDSNMKVDDVVSWGFATEIMKETSAKSTLQVYAYSEKTKKIIKSKSMKKPASKKNDDNKVLSLLNKLMIAAGLKKEATVTLANGTKIFGEGDFEKGVEIYLDAAFKKPLADGDHLLSDGSAITVEDGTVTNYLPQVAAKFLKGVQANKKPVAVKKPVAKNEAKTLDDETEIWCDGTLGDGVSVFTDEAMTEPLSDGDYTLSNGDTFTVTEGVVSNYTAAEGAEDSYKEQVTALKNTVNKLTKELNDQKKTNKEYKDQIEEIAQALEDSSFSTEEDHKKVITTNAQAFAKQKGKKEDGKFSFFKDKSTKL